MTFSEITTADIIVQEGTFAFDYDASGTVYAGQGVYAIGTLQVKAPATTLDIPKVQKGCVGVAAYGATDGEPVAVYGPGNIVNIRVSGTSTVAGDPLFLTVDGEFTEDSNPHEVACSGVRVIALETQATDSGIVRALLV